MSYPPALPHDPPLEIAQDLFVVHGCVRVNALVRFTRNMVIVRDEGQLTLINPVRVDDEGLAALEALGEIKHVLRLGPMHGQDDPFYVDRYNADFWAFEDGITYSTPTITHALTEGGPLPFSNAHLFAFKYMKEAEGAILLQRAKGILLTCDSIQNYATPPHTPHTNWFSRTAMPYIGFPNETLIGPAWLKLLVEDKDRDNIKAEFKRLLTLDFDQLIAAHGTFLPQGARASVLQAFEKRFS